MRMPWVQCSSSSDQYCIQPLIEATIVYHQLYMIGSCIIELRSHYSFDIVMSMGMLASSIYMSHPLMGTILIQKPKSHHAPAQKAPPIRRKSYDVCRPYDELPPSQIRGKFVKPKNTSMIFTWPTPPKDIYFTTLIWPPHPCKGSKT